MRAGVWEVGVWEAGGGAGMEKEFVVPGGSVVGSSVHRFGEGQAGGFRGH